MKQIKKSEIDKMRLLSQAFNNINKGQGVSNTELYKEYARLMGADGCPCDECLKKQWSLRPDLNGQGVSSEKF